MITFSDQQSHLEMIRPPAGHKLTYCLGTTYSLDLDCVVAMAHIASKNSWVENSGERNLFEILQGIAEFTQSSLVFCQACQIKALEKEQAALHAHRYGQLISLLDQFVVPVSAPGIGASFHPKIWLVRFDVDQGRGAPTYRVLVASRNLSRQMDWEIGCVLEGKEEAKANDLSRRLHGFIASLKQSVPKPKLQLFQRVLADLRTVAFQKPPRTKSAQILFKDAKSPMIPWVKPSDYEGLIVVSPFISSEVVSGLANGISRPNRFYLVTSVAHAFKLKGLTDIHDHCFVFDPNQVNVEGVGDVQMGLHAKIYIGLKVDRTGSDVLLGSANCTTNGLIGLNTEAMVRLDCSVATFGEFLGNFLFQEIRTEKPYPWLRRFKDLEAEELRAAEEKAALEKKLSDIQAALAVGQFRLHVEAGSRRARLWFLRPKNFAIPAGARVKVTPWGCARPRNMTECLKQEGASFYNKVGFLSDFVHVEVSVAGVPPLKFMTRAFSNINKRSRNRAVIGSYLREPSAFFRYLRLVLKMPVHTTHSGSRGSSSSSRKKRTTLSRLMESSFLEEVLVGASHNPVVISQITEALEAVDRKNIALREFTSFWQRFLEAHEEVAKGE